MNAMLYVRGRPIDYDLWESEGAAGWGWQDVEPYFSRAEDYAAGADEIHGAGGPLRTANVRSPHDLTNQFYAAAEAAGIPYNRDYNGPEQDGVSPSQVTQHGGKRWSAADAYLKPNIKRPNLTVRTNVTVRGLRLEGDRVTGLELAGPARALRGRGRGPRRDPVRRLIRLPAATDGLGHRARRPPGQRGRDRTPRPARRGPEPARPPLLRVHLGRPRRTEPARRREAAGDARMAAAQVGPADLAGGRGPGRS